ncbi:MAG TPA: deoxyribonuclease V [Dehalococcoidia bacterium]
MSVRSLHPWNVSPEEAIRIQRRLASQVISRGEPEGVELVAGVDISVDRAGRGRGAVVVLSYPELRLVERVVEEREVPFPYVPGLLSFREAPVLLPALERLRHRPDLLLVDGQGLAHPRRFGIACHLGLLLDLPAIGCGKSRLVGEYREPGPAVGDRAPLVDRGQVVGQVVRTRAGVKPVFVSPGHRIGLEEAVAWVLRCARGYRLPEPTRLADAVAGGRRVPGTEPPAGGRLL